MKQVSYPLFTLLFCLMFGFASAQSTTPSPNVKTTVRTRSVIGNGRLLDTNEVVYDESGKALKYYQSQKLLNTGEYTMVPNSGDPNAPGTTWRLKKTTVAQQTASYESVRTTMAIPGPYLKEGQPLDVTPLLSAVSAQELENKIIVMIFWSSDCPPCTESFEALNDFFTQIHNPESIVILAITTHDQLSADAKLKEKPLYHAQLLSNARRITNAYQLNVYPAFVVTDREHVIHFASKGLGPVSIAAFKNVIRSVLYQ
jgi:peroxiredoxin